MKKRYIVPLALAACLALPAGAYAQVEVKGNGKLLDFPASPAAAAAAYIDGTSSSWYVDANGDSVTFDGTGKNYLFTGNWKFHPSETLTQPTGIVLTSVADGKFTFNTDIDFEAAGKAMSGFLYATSSGGGSNFAGNLNAKNIRVYNNTGNSGESATGIGLVTQSSNVVNGLTGLDADGVIKAGNLDVFSAAADASAFYGGAIAGSVTVNDITAAAANEVQGFHIASIEATTGKINAGNINVSTVGDTAVRAQGVRVTGNVAGTAKVGNVNVSGAADTYGIRVKGNVANTASLTAGDINAQSGSSAVDAFAVGFAVEGSLAGNIATGNINAEGLDGAVGVLAETGFTGTKTVDGKTVSTVNFGEINALATGEEGLAAGIVVEAGTNRFAVMKNVTAEATGKDGMAYGISMNAATTLDLGSTDGSPLDITGRAINGDAHEGVGLYVTGNGGTTLNIAGRVNITGNDQMGDDRNTIDPPQNVGIYLDDASNTLTVNLADNAHLVTNGVIVTERLTIDSAKNGRADLGSLSADTAAVKSVVINNQKNGKNGDKGIDSNAMTAVSVNIMGSNVTNYTIGDRVVVEGYGEVTNVDTPVHPEAGHTLAGFTFNGADKTKATSSFKNLNVFSDIRVCEYDMGTGSGFIGYFGILDKANMNDGFLTALRMHNRSAIGNAARNHMISFAGNRYYRGQECDPCAPVSECDPCEAVCDTNPCDPCDPCGTFGGKSRRGFSGFTFGGNGNSTRNAWVNYVGRADSYESSHNGSNWKIGMDGVQVGSDLYRTNRTQLGVVFGYEGGNAYNANDKVEADDTYIGMYGARVLRNGADVRFSLGYGWQDYTQYRQSVNLPPYPPAYFLSEFEGKTFEASFELGKRFYRGNWSFRPVVGLDFSSNEIDGAAETALTAVANDGPLAFGDSDLTQAFVRVGSDLRFQRKRFTFDSGLYLSYDMNSGSDELTARVVQISAPQLNTNLVGSELGRTLLTFNVGGSYQLCKNLSVFGGYQGEALLGGDAGGYMSTGHVGGAWRW